VRHVTSRHNPRLSEAASLLASSRERRKSGKCVLEGVHVVAAYAEQRGAPETLIVTEAALALPDVRALVDRHEQQTLLVPESLFVATASLPASVGVIAVVPTPQSANLGHADFNLLVDEVQDPGNIGSMLRSAAAAGVTQVLLSKHCAFAWSPKVLRAGQGAHFRVAIHEDVDLPAWAAEYRAGDGEVVATVAAGGTSLFAAPLAGRVALAIGNEGGGLSPALAAQATQRVTIPMPGGIESLNVAAAAAVCLFECLRQRDTNERRARPRR
jgi:TrmH family RNA methyltransferase